MERIQQWFYLKPPALRWLLAVNIGLFVVFFAFGLVDLLTGIGLSRLFEFLMLHPGVPGILLKPWQVLTYAFVDPVLNPFGVIGFIFSMMWLAWLGQDYEQFYGSHRLLSLYILSTLGGALFAILLTLLPGANPAFLTPQFGAWTPVVALLVCVATINPDREIGLFLLGLVKLKWVAVGVVVLFGVLGLFGGQTTILGGALVGYLFARAQQQGSDWGAWARPLFDSAPRRAPRTRQAKPSVMSKVDDWMGREEPTPRSAPRRTAQAPPKKRGATDVDRILDKISETGYDSLTDDEKKVLYEASQR